MNKMTDAQMERRLRDGAQAMAPKLEEKTLRTPVTLARGDEWYLDGVNKKRRNAFRHIAAAAACLVLLLTALAAVPRAAATVYLDVNPSVTLTLDRNDRVLRAEAGNADGEVILSGMKLRRTDVNVAVNAIIGSMVRHGYLTEAKNVILLSVDGRNSEQVSALRIELSNELTNSLTAAVGSYAVFDQSIEDDDELEELAEELDISPGKAALIRRLVAADAELDAQKLADMPLSELQDYLKRAGLDLCDYANYSGSDDWDDDGEDDDHDAGYDTDDTDDADDNDDEDGYGADGDDADDRDADDWDEADD